MAASRRCKKKDKPAEKKVEEEEEVEGGGGGRGGGEEEEESSSGAEWNEKNAGCLLWTVTILKLRVTSFLYEVYYYYRSPTQVACTSRGPSLGKTGPDHYLLLTRIPLPLLDYRFFTMKSSILLRIF